MAISWLATIPLSMKPLMTYLQKAISCIKAPIGAIDLSSFSLPPFSVGREKIGQTGVRTWDSLNVVRVCYRYATQSVVGGIINSNTFQVEMGHTYNVPVYCLDCDTNDRPIVSVQEGDLGGYLEE
jgi:hypothetical protein